MILSRQKCCLLLNGASTESQKLTRVRQIRRDFSPTRNMAVDIDTTDNQNDNHKVTWWCTAVCFSAVVIAGHLHEESLKRTMHSRCFLSIYCCKELPDNSLLSTLLFIWWLVQHCWWLLFHLNTWNINNEDLILKNVPKKDLINTSIILMLCAHRT